VRKWTDTGIFGTLKLVRIKDMGDVPIYNVRVYSADEHYQTRVLVLEYELPTNF